jgi:SAM-dependent methyltransferase
MGGVASEPIYEAYAPIYDAIGQARFSARMAGWSLRWLAARGARPRRVLDLACGTGEAALVFAGASCSVIGVDRSAAMLGIARGRARGAGYGITFVEGDIRDLPTNDERRTTNERSSDVGHWSLVIGRWSFDLVTCFYDSLNYLTGDGDLGRVFDGVSAALAPNGYLVFDLNTAAEYATWDERDTMTCDGEDCLVYNRLSYEPSARLATGRIVWFVREIDRWWRGEETHIERAWSDAEVCAALAGAGLALIGRWDVVGAVVPEGAGDVGRVVYVARRLNAEEAESAEGAEDGSNRDSIFVINRNPRIRSK